MEPAGAAWSMELASPELGGEVYDFLHPYAYIHPDLDREAFAACWRSQFFGCGPPFVLVARDSRGKLIAHYGVMPMPYISGGRSARAGFICQLFVDPAWRRSTLFLEMEERILEKYGDFGFDFLYGLITIKPVLQAHLNLGYTRGADWYVHAAPLAAGGALTAVRPGAPEWVARLVSAVGAGAARVAVAFSKQAARGIAVTEIGDYGEIDWRFVAATASGRRMCAERSEAAFRRRFEGFGRKRYRVFAACSDGKTRGYLALRITEVQRIQVAAVIDVIAAPADEAAWTALLAAAARAGLAAGAHALAALARPGSPEARSYSSNLLAPTPSYFTLVYAAPEASPVLADDWALSWYDHDYI